LCWEFCYYKKRFNTIIKNDTAYNDVSLDFSGYYDENCERDLNSLYNHQINPCQDFSFKAQTTDKKHALFNDRWLLEDQYKQYSIKILAIYGGINETTEGDSLRSIGFSSFGIIDNLGSFFNNCQPQAYENNYLTWENNDIIFDRINCTTIQNLTSYYLCKQFDAMGISSVFLLHILFLINFIIILQLLYQEGEIDKIDNRYDILD